MLGVWDGWASSWGELGIFGFMYSSTDEVAKTITSKASY